MALYEQALYEHISYFKTCIYDAYHELNVSDEYSFNLLKNEAINEAIDDIRTEPLMLGDYRFDTVMNLAIKEISFNEYRTST